MKKFLQLIRITILLLVLFHKYSCSKPLVIAHRGASGYLPEQTMEAKVMAYMMNSDYIEIDVILSKDNKLIVCHDIVIDELTNVKQVFPDRARNDSRYYIFDFTYDELKKLNLTERFTNWRNLTDQKYPDRFPLWKSNFRLHTFSEGLELIEGLHKTYKLRNSDDNSIKNVSFLIEIKRPYLHRLNNKHNLSEILIDTLTKYGYNTDKSLIIIQSFDPFELSHIKFNLKSPLRLVQLLLKSSDLDYQEEIGRIDYDYWNSPAGLKNISKFAIGIAAEKSLLYDIDKDKGTVKESEMYKVARDLNLSVFGWTFRLDQLPNHINNFNQLLDIFTKNVKIDGFITDFPADVISYLKNNSETIKLHERMVYLCLLLFLLFIY